MFTCVLNTLATYVYPCLLEFTYVYLLLPMFTRVYLCLAMFSRVYLCFTVVYLSLPLHHCSLVIV